MRFLFHLDLSLHTGAGIFFGILIFATKRGPRKRKKTVTSNVSTPT